MKEHQIMLNATEDVKEFVNAVSYTHLTMPTKLEV